MGEWRTALVLLLALWGGWVSAQEPVWDVEVVGMAGRPYQWNEILPLTGAEVPVASGSVNMDGRVQLVLPGDDRLHTFVLQCAGVVWTLPLCGAPPEGHRLVPPKAGGAPFNARPGAIEKTPEMDAGLPLQVAALQDAMAEVEVGLGTELQRTMLWNGVPGRGGESGALGSPIGSSDDGDAAASDSLLKSLLVELRALAQRHSDGQPDAVRVWMEVLVNGPCMDVDSEVMSATRSAWAAAPAPDPLDMAAVRRFADGADRFATVAALPDSLVAAYAKGLGKGDWEALVLAGAGWWGQPDEDKSAAWFAHVLGRDAFGVRRSGRPFAGRKWTAAWNRLLDRVEAHPIYGPEVTAWRAADTPVGQMPASLRAFNAAQNLVDIESVVGSGPALWLWLDASAPSTTIQLQVLERMLADPASQRLMRGMTWVVADAGTDFEAFERLAQRLAERFGGLNRMPFELLHTGGDIRWSQAFELSALPVVRQHGMNRVPVSADLPLPGPELSRRLARRP